MQVSGQLHSSALYPQGKSPCYPLDRRLDGPQIRSGRGGEEVNSHLLAGFKPPIFQPVAQIYTTELSRLLRHYTYRCDAVVALSTVTFNLP
jgi:hypothetical protein